MSSCITVKEETHPKSRAFDDDTAPASKSSESSLQPAMYQAHAIDKTDAGSTAVHTIWPADTIATSSKQQCDRIIEAIKSVTDKPEEIHNCLLGEVLVFAKAYMTAAQAASLRYHPDVSAVEIDRGNSN